MDHCRLFLSSTTALFSLAAFIFFTHSQISPFVYGKTDPSSSTRINRDLYHTSADLMKLIRALVHRHPDKLSFDTFKNANKGYHAKLEVVTYSRSPRKDFKSKIRVLLSFGQHGRELITSELALRILSILSEEHSLPHMDIFSLNATLDKLVIKVVPIENLNGRILVEEGKLCERKNGRGVDLNRNWSVDWGKKEKDYDPHEENPGTAPFSEPETQMMQKLSISFDPHIWINVHSGMEALFMPYDHKNKTPDGLASRKLRSLLEELNSLHCHNHCMVGSGGGSVGYLAHGTATDYMYDIVRVPMAFTFEIYGDASAKDCFKMFNPASLDNFSRVVNDWSAAFFTVFRMGGTRQEAVNGEEMVAFKSEKPVWMDENAEEIVEAGGGMQGKKNRGYIMLLMLLSLLFMFRFFCPRVSKTKPIALGV